MNSANSATASKIAGAAPASPNPPTLKLSTLAASRNSNVNAALATSGIFSATAPSAGRVTAYFFGPRTTDVFPQVSAGSGNQVAIKLLPGDLEKLGDGPVSAYVYYDPLNGGAYSDFATISFVLDTTAPVAPSLNQSQSVLALKGVAGAGAGQAGAVSVTGAAGDSITSVFKGSRGSVTLKTRASGSLDPLALSAAQLASLGQGRVTVTSVASDPAGNVSKQSSAFFDLDTVAPNAPKVGMAAAVSANKGTATQLVASKGAVTVQGVRGDTLTTTFTNSSGVSVDVTMPADGTARPVALTSAQLQTLGGGLIKTATVESDPAGNKSALASVSFNLEAPVVQPGLKTVARIDFYVTATNLYEGMQFNLRMMEGALNTSKDTVEIYALWDQASSGKFASGGGKQAAWGDVGTALLSPNPSGADPVSRPGVWRNEDVDTQTIYTTFERGPELDTGDVANLKNFVSKAAGTGASSVSSRTLILSDHGGGILSGLNFDTPADDGAPASGGSISGVQLSSLLSQSSGVPKYDIVAFDECLMGGVEMAYGLKNVTKYMLASEETVGGNGYDYFRTLAGASKPLGAVELGKRFVDAFREGYGSKPLLGESNTLSFIDLSRMTEVASKMKAFVNSMVAVGSQDFWNSVGNVLLRGTYYGFSYYQDLAGFVGRVARVSDAPQTVKTAAGDLLDSLGGAVLNNTVQSGGVNLVPARGMTPVEQGSYGLSVVLPYNADSLAEMTQGADLQSFVDDSYRGVAGEFLQATGWDRLLLALDENNCFRSARSPLVSDANNDGAKSAVARYTDASKLDFYLGFADYADNSTGNPLDNNVTHPLGFLNGYATGSAAKVRLGNLKVELEVVSPSDAPLDIYIWDTAKNKALASMSAKATGNVVFDLSRLSQALQDTLVSPTMELRVQTKDELGVGFSPILHLNGARMAVPAAGLTKAAPKVLSTTDTYVSAQILDDSNPERWYKFTTDRLRTPLAIETLSVEGSDDASFTLEVIQDPGTSGAKTVRREGSIFMGEYFLAEAASEYAVHVYKTDPKDGKSVDFELSVAPQIDSSGFAEFIPDVLSLSQKFEDQGKIAVSVPGSGQGKLSANFFADEAVLGSVFSGVGAVSTSAVAFTEIKEARSSKSLSRASVEDLVDESAAVDLLAILKDSAGASIGRGAAQTLDLSRLGAAFTVLNKPSKTSSTVYKSTDEGVIPGIYDDDVYVGFGNGDQISLDSGVYRLPTAKGKHGIDFTVANGNARPDGKTSGQTDALFFYKVDSVSGDLYESGKWIHPGDASYAASALKRAREKAWITTVRAASGVETSLDLQGGRIAMGVVANGTVADMLAKNPLNAVDVAHNSAPHAFFSVAGANPDKISHMISLGNSCYSFEDVVGGGRNDFTGLMVRFDGAALG
jgi:hypothetical protein